MLKDTIVAAVGKAKLALTDLAVPAQLVVRGEVSYIPGVPVSPDETSHSVKVVMTKYAIGEIDGDRIQASDLKGLSFPELNVPTPKIDDRLIVGSSTYRILYNELVMAGDVPVLSQMQLRPV